MRARATLILSAALGFSAPACTSGGADVTLLNVSFDATREFYEDVNAAFAAAWKARTGRTVAIHQSHGGSGKQARAVNEGLEADVVTLALALDVDRIAAGSGRIDTNWRGRLPWGSSPLASTVVFVVRRGNPLRIRDWEDLARPGVAVVTPNPKVSGGARWNYLAAWAFARRRFAGDARRVEDFMARLYRNAPVLDSGARAAGTTFVQREIGDVLVAWESEARFLIERLGAERGLEIVVPSMSVLAELPVSVVDDNVRRHGTRAAAEAYLAFLYSPEGQRLGVRHHFRPRLPEVQAATAAAFPAIDLVTVDALAGGWQAAQRDHFDAGGAFDRVFRKVRAP